MCHVAATVQSIIQHFEGLPDPRNTCNRLHLLGDIMVISMCGVIVGCDGPTAIERWAKAKREWLEEILPLPNGIPSRDCIRRVLGTLRPEAFQTCFESWIAGIRAAYGEADSIVAIDGKTMRRSHDRKAGLGPLHMVGAWASEQGLILGQVATEEKSNEITAIPELIDRIDIKNSVVTIDAMGCQKKIAKKIIDDQGDYVIAVKGNQPKLYEAVKTLFRDEHQDELMKLRTRSHRTSDKGHGRKDERHYVLAKLPSDSPLKKQWPGLTAVGMAVRTTETRDGTMSGDTRYFICSRFSSGRRFAEAVRGHWGIENSLHWVLDVTFNEDQSRTRNRRMADNLTWLRRFGISLLKRHPAKSSLIGKSQMAGWNNDFLLEVLSL